jgi:hypothetical protein
MATLNPRASWEPGLSPPHFFASVLHSKTNECAFFGISKTRFLCRFVVCMRVLAIVLEFRGNTVCWTGKFTRGRRRRSSLTSVSASASLLSASVQKTSFWCRFPIIWTYLRVANSHSRPALRLTVPAEWMQPAALLISCVCYFLFFLFFCLRTMTLMQFYQLFLVYFCFSLESENDRHDESEKPYHRPVKGIGKYCDFSFLSFIPSMDNW